MCLQLVLQMQHTDYSNLKQSGVDKESSAVAVLATPLPPLNKSAAGVELLVFCIHLFSIQILFSRIFPFLAYVYFPACLFL